jgi:hypothetical protein
MMGTRVYVRSLRGWPWRLGRLGVSAAGTFAPALAGGLLWWLLALDESGRRAILATSFVFDDWLASRGLVLGAAGLSGILLLAVVLLVLRALLDAAWFGVLRDTATGIRRSVRGWWHETAVVFFGLSLIRLGLFMGSLMFLSPFFRVAGRMAVHEGASLRTTTFIAISIGVSVGVLAYLSFFLCVTAAYLSYRPRFFAGTVIAGIAAPFRQWRQFVWIAPCYMVVWAALWLAGSMASTELAGAWFQGLSVPESATAAGLVAATGFMLGAWFDAFLTALVGHRLGDVTAATLESNLQGSSGNAKAHGMSSSPQIPASLRFEPPVRGLFASPHPRHELHSTVAFSEILSVEQDSDLPENWKTGDSTIDTSLADAALQSGAVAPEISLQGAFPSPTSAHEVAAPHESAWPASHEGESPARLAHGGVSGVQLKKAESDRVSPDLNRLASVGGDPQAQPVDEVTLVASAGRTTYRSASGALERSIQ